MKETPSGFDSGKHTNAYLPSQSSGHLSIFVILNTYAKVFFQIQSYRALILSERYTLRSPQKLNRNNAFDQV